MLFAPKTGANNIVPKTGANNIVPKTGANNIVPKIGAMKNLRLSIYSTEHLYLRQMLTARRIELGLSHKGINRTA
ncbi:hypothetical protein [Neisseria weixii]|uniref:hypothetical protein n=1 Tax=Neisseria weixii TaxID=1853276 RepID=UPI0030B7FC1A